MIMSAQDARGPMSATGVARSDEIRDRPAVCLAGGVLLAAAGPGAGPLVRHQFARPRAAGRARRELRQLQAAVHRRSLSRRLAVLAAHRRTLDARHAAAGLSHGLRHRPGAAVAAPAAADAGDPAVLDLVPDPRLCVDGPAGRERHPQPGPALVGPGAQPGHHPRHRMGDPSRHHLRLPAVHGAAALQQPREARLGPARSRVRPRRQAIGGVRHRHPAPVDAGHRRRLPDGVHPRSRRVRDPRPAGRHAHADDRQGAVGRVFHQFRLAARLGGGDLPAGPAGRPDRDLSAASAAQPGADMTIGRARFAFTVLAFGYAFLYLPIALVIVYSFNESRLVTVWAGFSTKWWVALFHNEAMLDAAWLSLRIGLASATLATLLGVAAGYALARVPRFAGRTLFASLVVAPMVMPEVVMGISMLLLFVGSDQLLGGPARGFLTIVIGHVTFSLAFVSIVVQARLADFDRSLEEAAMDLGATPLVTFLTVTLPLIAPALISGWLLAFTLSLDDLILTQFVAGAQSQTLPMRVYSSVRLGVDPQINVLATIVVGIAASALIASAVLTRRSRVHSQTT